MNKLKVIVLSAVMFGGVVASAASVSVSAPTSTVHAQPSRQRLEMPPAYIDGIKIPYWISRGVEIEFPGHAIVKAEKTKVNNKVGYRLQIDRGMTKEKVSRYYLYFDAKWKFVNHTKVASTPAQRTSTQQATDDERPHTDVSDDDSSQPSIPSEPREDKPGDSSGANDEAQGDPQPDQPGEAEPLQEGESSDESGNERDD